MPRAHAVAVALSLVHPAAGAAPRLGLWSVDGRRKFLTMPVRTK